MMPTALSGLSSITNRFDAAILDQWGVLHDGAKAPPGAIDAVVAMAQAGKKLVVLSNSARLQADASGRLRALGYDLGMFTGFVTSGETVRTMLRDRTDPYFAALGKSVFLIARDPVLIEGLDYRQASSIQDADFVLLGSSTAPEMSLAEHYAGVLAQGAKHGLPAVCANPDRVGVAPSGLIEGPGLLADFYEQHDGVVRYVGKPHPEVYARCSALLEGIPPSRILAVGDSLEHDIAGGRNAGFLTAFVQQGIHAADLTSPDGAARLYGKFSVTPDFAIPRLAW